MLDFLPEKMQSVNPVEAYFGEGFIRKVGEVVRSAGSRPLVVTGASSARSSGALDKLVSSIEKEGLSWDLYEGVPPDPPVSAVVELIGRLREGEHDVVAALGGGSVMDAAKVAARDARGVKCVTVPTTSGSGSEVTRYAVLSIPDEKRKFIQVDMRLVPEAAVVDPELALCCPPELTTVTGLDTLSHHIEGYFNVKARKGADPVALEGIRMTMRHLPAAYADGSNAEARAGMSKAALMGGYVIHFKPAGLPHGLSYSFYGILPHGSAVAVLLPYCWKYYIPVLGERSIKAAEALGVDTGGMSGEQAAAAGIEKLFELYEELGHPTSFADVKEVDDAFIDRAARAVLDDTAKMDATPRRPDYDKGYDDLTSILNAAKEGNPNLVF